MKQSISTMQHISKDTWRSINELIMLKIKVSKQTAKDIRMARPVNWREAALCNDHGHF